MKQKIQSSKFRVQSQLPQAYRDTTARPTVEPREAFGVRGIPALSPADDRTTIQSAGIPRTPNASRGSGVSSRIPAAILIAKVVILSPFLIRHSSFPLSSPVTRHPSL